MLFCFSKNCSFLAYFSLAFACCFMLLLSLVLLELLQEKWERGLEQNATMRLCVLVDFQSLGS